MNIGLESIRMTEAWTPTCQSLIQTIFLRVCVSNTNTA